MDIIVIQVKVFQPVISLNLPLTSHDVDQFSLNFYLHFTHHVGNDTMIVAGVDNDNGFGFAAGVQIVASFGHVSTEGNSVVLQKSDDVVIYFAA